MKNSAIFYGVIALGVIILGIGIYYLTGAAGAHQIRAEVGLGVGALLLIVGVVGLFMARPKVV